MNTEIGTGQREDLASMYLDELKMFCVSMGEPAFRGTQLFSWLHGKGADSFDEMTSLPKAFREKLRGSSTLSPLEILTVQTSKIDGTRKYLFRLSDGNCIESVFMRYRYGCSVCVSTQVGCRMGCRFCASTVDGLVRSLLPSEMLRQVYLIGRDTGERISNVVLMGSGEPMENYGNVVRFIRLLNAPEGLNLSCRNITVSTCGLTEGILALSGEDLPVTLALSLHAADDETRKKLMPVANRYSIKDILSACGTYYEKTGRRVSIEYSLVAGVNDTPEEADKLVRLLKGRGMHVNLIPVNPVRERSFRESPHRSVERFRKMLENGGINVTIRREMGRDIDGACGQLRRSWMTAGGEPDGRNEKDT